MARDSRDILHISTRGIGVEGDRMVDFTAEQRKAQNSINRTMRELQRQTTAIYQQHAPVLTGDLKRSIVTRAHFRSDIVTLTAGANARHRGFNYTPVTRFGHARAIVTPKRARALVFRGRSGKKVVRAWVRGYKPAGDWARRADPQITLAVARAQRAIGRDIQTLVMRDF